MAAVSPVMDDGKLKSRANSPDYPKHLLKRQSSCKDGEQGYESDFPVKWAFFKLIFQGIHLMIFIQKLKM